MNNAMREARDRTETPMVRYEDVLRNMAINHQKRAFPSRATPEAKLFVKLINESFKSCCVIIISPRKLAMQAKDALREEVLLDLDKNPPGHFWTTGKKEQELLGLSPLAILVSPGSFPTMLSILAHEVGHLNCHFKGCPCFYRGLAEVHAHAQALRLLEERGTERALKAYARLLRQHGNHCWTRAEYEQYFERRMNEEALLVGSEMILIHPDFPSSEAMHLLDQRTKAAWEDQGQRFLRSRTCMFFR
jgi:hypothetical protein